MTDDQRRSRGVPEGGTPGLATVHNLFTGRAAGRPVPKSGSGKRTKPGDGPAENTVVGLDGSRLNQHDLRDMIAQKEAEWRASQAEPSGSERHGSEPHNSEPHDSEPSGFGAHGVEAQASDPHASGSRGSDTPGSQPRNSRTRSAGAPASDAHGSEPFGAEPGELAQPSWSTPDWAGAPTEGSASKERRKSRSHGELDPADASGGNPGRNSARGRGGRGGGTGFGGRGARGGRGGIGAPNAPNAPSARSGGRNAGGAFGDYGSGALGDDRGTAGPFGEDGADGEDTARPTGRRKGERPSQGLSRKRRDGSSGWGTRGDSSSAEGQEGHEGHEGEGNRLSRPRPPIDPELEAREILLKQLSAGDRTRSQLAKVLAQKEIPDDVAAAVLDRFEEVDLVDDAAFSKQYVENRHTGKGLAKRALAYELRRKGVADETVREAVDSLSSDDELSTARQLVRKKAGSMTKDDPERRLRRLAGMLARKGYSSGIAYQAIREELAELDAEGMFGHPDFD